MPDSAPVDHLLRQFRQAFADVNLSPGEARHLRDLLLNFQRQHGSVEGLRHQLFELARERFNTFKDKAVIEWLEAASALLPAEEAPASTVTSGAGAARARAFFSPREECVAGIREFIADARRTLDVCVFTVADDRLTEALLAAHRRGVRVRLLTDNEKLYDKGSDVRALHAAGVPVRVDRTANHMHHKFALADDAWLLTGSYNWTRSAAEYNLENLLITPDAHLVSRYAAEFARLWQELPEFTA
ncbi:hypothetical protein KLP40_02420 [Hymenobacter sp. NST-14]|uniref:phospholipase D-like domain-containing protein n=1 Tax=Hymenobacter piscis TaxID=2839984 RepID=UPI001C024C2D|nr:phospholipase D-like domain-containing protein [Hymenobacter piscis]MBT9392007.1 hypothetical protein [Hymenobacter piscis]